MISLDPIAFAAIFAAFALGGILKGATGAGTPVIAVPVMAAFLDVRVAVVLMVLPNFVTNFMQLYQYWDRRLQPGFWWKHAAAGVIGAGVGTWLLATLPTRLLLVMVAVAVVSYIALRLARPDFKLARDIADKLAIPAGILGGILQGAAGISAPVTVSFLNAMRLERPVFISTISAFFGGMTLAQFPAQFATGLMTVDLLLLSVLALIPLFIFMPVGSWAAKRMSAKRFDQLVLLLLTGLALRLIWVIITG